MPDEIPTLLVRVLDTQPLTPEALDGAKQLVRSVLASVTNAGQMGAEGAAWVCVALVGVHEALMVESQSRQGDVVAEAERFLRGESG
jgi:hypothetical protein